MQSYIFYITLKDIRPKQNRNRIYTIAVGNEGLSESYKVKLYWGRVGAKRQQRIYTRFTQETLDQFVRNILRTRLKHGYLLVEKHPNTPNYHILNEFRSDSLYPKEQLGIF